MLKSCSRFCTWMATELDPGPITPAMGFLVEGGGWCAMALRVAINAPLGPVLVVPDGDEGVPDELDALLQSHGGVPAGVSDLTTQAYIWEQSPGLR